MSQPQTALNVARRDAQDLHKKISANIAKADHATWNDVATVQVEAAALATKMKTIAENETDPIKTGLRTASAKLDAIANRVQDKALAVKDDVKHANAAMLESARKAAQSLSEAVATLRTKIAKTIEPKKVLP